MYVCVSVPYREFLQDHDSAVVFDHVIERNKSYKTGRGVLHSNVPIPLLYDLLHRSVCASRRRRHKIYLYTSMRAYIYIYTLKSSSIVCISVIRYKIPTVVDISINEYCKNINNVILAKLCA